METGLRRSFVLIVIALTFTCMFAGSFMAQTADEDPNSPPPVLLTQADSIRALAISASTLGRVNLRRVPSRPFPANGRVVLFVSGISLMKDEGAKAFRVYVEAANGKNYRFPVQEIREYPSPVGDTIYALSTQLSDELGFWDAPEAGDVLIAVTWRGLISNKAIIGIGTMGGGLKIPQNASPAPLGTKAQVQVSQPSYVGYRWSGDRMRFLEQATFGPNATLDARIRRIGPRAWLAEQFDLPYPSASNPYPNQPLKPANAPSDCDGDQTVVPDVPTTCNRDSYTMYQPQTWFFREALYGDAQLRHRAAWALAQVWVTSGNDVQQGRHMVEYHKILSANAFGNFRNLMKQMTLNPAMGGYLDMAISTRNNPNENYAREIMQLFTIGLFMLNQDGTLQRDSNNNPIPTYDQNVVNNMTKVLTGWTFCQTPGTSCPNLVSGAVNYIDPLLLTRNNHDLTAKTLLSYPGSTTTNVAACTGCTGTAIDAYANNSMDQALDNIFNHPNVGPFISKILIQHLVTSDPTPQYVSDVAAVFNNNGFGVRGDMKAVVKAILLHPEARGDVKTDPNYGKLREPVQLLTNVLRTFNAKSANGTSLSDGYFTGRVEFTGMAQVPFLSPTVFNFYPPDYVVPGTAMVGPEFAIMNTGTSITRANFANRFVFTAPAVTADGNNAPNGTSLDFSDLQAISAGDSTGNQLVDELNRRMLHSTMSPAMKNTILTAVTSFASSDTLNRVRQAVYLIATSSQYQVQR